MGYEAALSAYTKFDFDRRRADAIRSTGAGPGRR